MLNTLLFALSVVQSRALDVQDHENCSKDMEEKIDLLLKDSEKWTLEDAVHVVTLLEAHLRDLKRT